MKNWLLHKVSYSMTESQREIEVKFCVRRPPPAFSHLPKIRNGILRKFLYSFPRIWGRPGGGLIQPRTLEVNLRFDNPEGELTKARRTLRLRKDNEARLTYKDGGQTIKGAISRREIEFVVSDFEAAEQFIEALGYETVFIYEKYRTTYEVEGRGGLTSLKGLKSLTSPTGRKSPKSLTSPTGLRSLMAKIMVDELPYGNFVEIEGDLEMLRPIAKELGLDWSKAIPASYFMLFERLKKARRLKFRDLTFENFKGIKVKPEEMGIEYADRQK